MKRCLVHSPILSLGTILLFIAGCSRDLSHDKHFQHVVRSEVRLVEPMELEDVDEDSFRMCDPSVSRPSNLVALLPVGTPLQITSVRETHGFKSDAVVAYGTVILPGTDESARWSFTWGFNGWVGRAPWEDPATTPKGRRVGEDD